MRFPVEQPYVITTKFSAAHTGLDIAPVSPQQGRPCVAPENAVVTGAGYVESLEGHYIILKGDSGYFYYFGHFASRSVVLNQRVLEGQQIGIIGMTGLATGIHTHHEVRKTQVGNAIDPATYYKKGEQVEVWKDSNDVRVNGYLLYGINIDPATNGDALSVWVGKSKLEFFKGLGPQVVNNTNALNKQIAQLQAAAKPATVLPKGMYQVV